MDGYMYQSELVKESNNNLVDKVNQTKSALFIEGYLLESLSDPN